MMLLPEAEKIGNYHSLFSLLQLLDDILPYGLSQTHLHNMEFSELWVSGTAKEKNIKKEHPAQ
jgi:hypothetical protein